MRARHQNSHPNRPPNGLGHPPLIHRPQICLVAVLDPAHLRNILAHDGEVLV